MFLFVIIVPIEELYFVVHEFKLPYLARIFMIKSIRIIELL